MSSKGSLFTVDWLITWMASILHPYLYTWLCPVTLQFLSLKRQNYFLIPWIWSWTYDLLWPTEWDRTDRCASTKPRPQETLSVFACRFLLLPLPWQVHACVIWGFQEKDEGHGEQSQVIPNKPKLDLASPETQERAQMRSAEPWRCRRKKKSTLLYTPEMLCLFVTQQFHGNS